MDPFDETLRQRLGGLEASVPVGPRGDLSIAPGPRRVPIALAAAAAMALFVAGLAIGRDLTPAGPVGHEGFENPGQPFHGTQLHCLNPRGASMVMTSRGFTVVWQLEDRDRGTTSIASSPPDAGYIRGGFTAGSVAHVVVDLGRDEVKAGDCP